MISETKYEIVILGATPGGISAAIAAARLGHSVALIDQHAHVGGMSSSGLSKSDIENRKMIGGIFREFTERIYTHYSKIYAEDHEKLQLCQEGYSYEPRVAEEIFLQMINECPGIELFLNRRLISVESVSERITSITVKSLINDEEAVLKNALFIDATYEGDLYAAAGAEYRVGRESRDEFDEPHAGKVYYDYQTHVFLEGSTGKADKNIPAYTYRLCLTTDPENSSPLTAPPPDYDRKNYLGYFDDLKQGRLAGPKNLKPGRGYYPAHFNTMMRALSVAEIPNSKYDVNINPRPLGFPFPEENAGYIEGDPETRASICQRHRNLTLGLLWFLQNDQEIPASHRKEANRFHLPADEFTDNRNFPFQLYVREARRLAGEYTLTENDITINKQAYKNANHEDCIAIGEFPIDSFPCRKRQPSDKLVLEGYLGMLDAFTRPYQIPYRIMIPKKVNNLIVPVAASTTHVAYSSIRMEPTWMALGQAAGVAASVTLKNKSELRDAPMDLVRTLLSKQGQILEFNQ